MINFTESQKTDVPPQMYGTVFIPLSEICFSIIRVHCDEVTSLGFLTQLKNVYTLSKNVVAEPLQDQPMETCLTQ